MTEHDPDNGEFDPPGLVEQQLKRLHPQPVHIDAQTIILANELVERQLAQAPPSAGGVLGSKPWLGVVAASFGGAIAGATLMAVLLTRGGSGAPVVDTHGAPGRSPAEAVAIGSVETSVEDAILVEDNQLSPRQPRLKWSRDERLMLAQLEFRREHASRAAPLTAGDLRRRAGSSELRATSLAAERVKPRRDSPEASQRLTEEAEPWNSTLLLEELLGVRRGEQL